MPLEMGGRTLVVSPRPPRYCVGGAPIEPARCAGDHPLADMQAKSPYEPILSEMLTGTCPKELQSSDRKYQVHRIRGNAVTALEEHDECHTLTHFQTQVRTTRDLCEHQDMMNANNNEAGINRNQDQDSEVEGDKPRAFINHTVTATSIEPTRVPPP